MITYTTANSKSDLEGILKLQKSNLPKNLNPEEIQTQVFVTVDHSYDLLKKMNDIEKHIIAKEQDKIIKYVLAMTKHSRFEISILLPMFNVLDSVPYKKQKISDYDYMLVGQVCVDKKYRGQGIFDKCYNYYREVYSKKYEFAITEIATQNFRSLNAHKRIGFEEIHSYIGPDKTEWIVVLWEWRNFN